MNADGTYSRRLTAGVELANWITPPSWSPDSTRIVIGRVKRPGSEPNVTVVDVRTARSRTIYRGGS
jgi:Tol biopolymer transport system component